MASGADCRLPGTAAVVDNLQPYTRHGIPAKTSLSLAAKLLTEGSTLGLVGFDQSDRPQLCSPPLFAPVASRASLSCQQLIHSRSWIFSQLFAERGVTLKNHADVDAVAPMAPSMLVAMLLTAAVAVIDDLEQARARHQPSPPAGPR
jgi:hypothetical protein